MTRRNTIQRTLVLEAVNALRCHATADEVFDLVVHDHPSVSRATVYRNLQRLCESGDIQRVEIPGGADRFDHQRYSHYHAMCVKCGRVFDVDMDYIPDMERHIRDRHGFTFAQHDIVFKGVCAECKGEEITKNS